MAGRISTVALNVRFEDELDGDASAIGGLFTGMADLAVLDARRVS